VTGTDLCVNKPHQSQSYLNHPVHSCPVFYMFWVDLDVTRYRRCSQKILITAGFVKCGTVKAAGYLEA
jgi:hypothetical protein